MKKALRKFRYRGLAVLVSAAAVVLLAPLPASAAQSVSFLRLAHLSPDTPQVDVTVTKFDQPNKSQVVKGVGYGAVSEYQRIEPGSYTVAMRPAGADPKSEPVISTTLEAAKGRAYTVAGLGRFADLALRVLNDEIGLPPAGQSRMRVVNAAPRAGDLSIQREGTAVIERAAFGNASSYVYVPAGQTTLTVAPVEAAATNLPINLEAGSVYTVLVLERDGALSAAVRQDARGATVVPNGAVETGLGGTADDDTGLRLLLLAAAGLAGAGAVLLVVRRRRIA
ncbi:MAG TPA: DUF4397 domain-containing protein [Actinophytocola sp.]|nr:DUF4397 domain-containing protein [Actinophytocola sp.]